MPFRANPGRRHLVPLDAGTIAFLRATDQYPESELATGNAIRLGLSAKSYTVLFEKVTADGSLPHWSAAEEIAHSVSHGVGIVLAIAGLVALVAVSVMHGDAWDVTSTAVYGTTLVLLYVASTLYHAIPLWRAKRVLRVLDHSAIYLLIAGTYTPIVLGPLRGPWGWTLFGVVWAAAMGGIVYKSVATGRAPILSTALYVIMGWCVVVAFGPLVRSVAVGGVTLLLAGGLCYTVGLVFYAWKGLRFHHFVWHLFVLAGSVLHWLAVLLYVIPPP